MTADNKIKLGFRVIGWRYRDANPVAMKAGLAPPWIVVWQTEKPTAAWRHFEVEPIFQPSEIVEARALALAICPELSQLQLRLQYFGIAALISRLSTRIEDEDDRDCMRRARRRGQALPRFVRGGQHDVQRLLAGAAAGEGGRGGREGAAVKTFTIEIERPDGRVTTYSGVRMIHRQRARRLRQRGVAVWRIGDGVWVWMPPQSKLLQYVEQDDTNRAAIAFTPVVTSFNFLQGGIAEPREFTASTEAVLPIDAAAALKRLGESFASGAEAGKALAEAIGAIKGRRP